MIKKMNKKGIGWMPDDIASVFFALFLIVIGFIIFNHVNQLVAQPNIKSVAELHQNYEQQQLLTTVLQSPMVVQGITNDAQTFVTEFSLTNYWLALHPKDQQARNRRDELQKTIIEGDFLRLLNTYQPLSKTFASSGSRYARDVYFTITLLDTKTNTAVNVFSHPKTAKKQKKIQATVVLPTPKTSYFDPQEYIVVVTIYKPKTTMQYLKSSTTNAQRVP